MVSDQAAPSGAPFCQATGSRGPGAPEPRSPFGGRQTGSRAALTHRGTPLPVRERGSRGPCARFPSGQEAPAPPEPLAHQAAIASTLPAASPTADLLYLCDSGDWGGGFLGLDTGLLRASSCGRALPLENGARGGGLRRVTAPVGLALRTALGLAGAVRGRCRRALRAARGVVPGLARRPLAPSRRARPLCWLRCVLLAAKVCRRRGCLWPRTPGGRRALRGRARRSLGRHLLADRGGHAQRRREHARRRRAGSAARRFAAVCDDGHDTHEHGLSSKERFVGNVTFSWSPPAVGKQGPQGRAGKPEGGRGREGGRMQPGSTQPTGPLRPHPPPGERPRSASSAASHWSAPPPPPHPLSRPSPCGAPHRHACTARVATCDRTTLSALLPCPAACLSCHHRRSHGRKTCALPAGAPATARGARPADLPGPAPLVPIGTTA